MSYSKSTSVNIVGSMKLRSPQIEAYLKIQNYKMFWSLRLRMLLI